MRSRVNQNHELHSQAIERKTSVVHYGITLVAAWFVVSLSGYACAQPTNSGAETDNNVFAAWLVVAEAQAIPGDTIAVTLIIEATGHESPLTPTGIAADVVYDPARLRAVSYDGIDATVAFADLNSQNGSILVLAVSPDGFKGREPARLRFEVTRSGYAETLVLNVREVTALETEAGTDIADRTLTQTTVTK